MIRSIRHGRLIAAVGFATAAVVVMGTNQVGASAPPSTVDLRVIGMNDFHGNLQAPSGSSGRVVDDNGATVDAGGAAFMATHLKQLRSEAPNSVVVAQGDLIGASPLASALFHDEPTIDVMNSIGLLSSAAGNHEFDEGYRELLRMQLGGCHPTDGCQFDATFDGAKFTYLGANVTFKNGGFPALPPFWLSFVDGVPVGYIGMPLKGTPEIVSAEGIKDLEFGDEVAAANRYADLLDRFGVKTIIMMIHQGDLTVTGNPVNGCALSGAPETQVGRIIAERVSPKIDAVFSAHSHQQYNCVVTDPAGNPRPYVQGASFGRVLSVVDFKIDRRTKDVIRSATVARNRIVTRTVPEDPDVKAIVDAAVAKSAPIGNRPIGYISANITRTARPSGELPLGDLIADAQLESMQSQGAQIAFMNSGGVRADLTFASSPAGEGDGVVTYAEAFTVQPFSNIMQAITLTGAQLQSVLEQQVQPTVTRILQPSAGFTYDWSPGAPAGSRATNLRLNGTPIDPAVNYRVAVSNFLADGGDGFTNLRNGTNRIGGPIDLDALVAYMQAHSSPTSPIAPPAADRIHLVP
jgi:5'-nucleotidase